MSVRIACPLVVALLLALPVGAQEKSAEECFREANTIFIEGDYAKAVELYQRAVKEKEDFKEAWFNLGAAYGQIREYEKEMAAYRKAIALAPGYARAHYNLALALEDNNQLDEALASYQKTLEFEPLALDALVNMGILLSRLDRLGDAEAAYRRALEVDSGEADIHYNLGVVYSKQARKENGGEKRKEWLQKEVESYQKALERRPSFYKACYNLALAYHRLGDLDNEIAAYERALSIKRSYPEGLYNLAYAYEEKGDKGKAMEYWKQYLEIASRFESEAPFVDMAKRELKRLEEETGKSGSPAADE